jgi:2-polyprenyl-3-methyl-5-hydroxy-6-metoxy-1,4-benzoquinol methylase
MTPDMLADMYSNYYPRNQISIESFTPFAEKNKIISWIDGDGAKAHTHIPRNVRVLDIGCGSCEALGYHRNRGCDVYGVDADNNASRIGERYGLKVKSGMFNPDDYEVDFFDFITLNDVLEHVIDPFETLLNARKVLKPHGKIIATLPNVNSVGRLIFKSYWVGWHTPYHLHFFSRKSLQTVAQRAGLKLHHIHFCTTYQRTLAQIGFIFARSPKGQKTSFTNLYGKFDPVNEKKLSVQAYKFLEKSRLLSPITRLLDIFHIGDSMTAIFEK